MKQIQDQSILVFKKNLQIFIKGKQYISDLFMPSIIIAVLVGAKYSDNISLKMLAIEFLPMSMLGTMRNITLTLVADKSERQKELQKIMGLRQSSYVIGWLMTNLLRMWYVQFYFLFITLTAGCLSSTVLSVGEVISSYLLYGLTQLSQSYLISTIVQTPKTAGDLDVTLNAIGSVLVQVLQIEYVQQNNFIIYILALIPAFAYNTLMFLQLRGLSLDTLNYGKSAYFSMMTFDFVFYGILYIYLDEVLPNEYGTNKHPLFFIGFRNNLQVQIHDTNDISMVQQLHNEQTIQITDDYSSAIYHENLDGVYERKAIQIQGLSKTFNNKTKAVDGLSLSIYSSQILCLLGHNGAGKTTAISLLTGLIKKDSGEILYEGRSTDTNLDQIRQSIGFCPQKDVLYDLLNAEEHLWYYGSIKGLTDDLPREIEDTIIKCALQQERHKIAKTLSGGNRRKLCLAIALIGRSKVIFLDEPTSGLDPISRRKVWDILQQIKQEGKCLVLTTHHLDEAEVLSERIAVMAKGKLLTVGSVDFIKRNFGIGYNLSIYNLHNTSTAWNNKIDNLKKIVQSRIRDSKVLPQSANEQLQLSLPFDQKQQFLVVFEELEKDNTIQIALSINSLEEAFINIGIDEDAFLKRTQNQDNQGNIQQDQEIQQQVLEEIEPPQCLSQAPKYSFQSQMKACLYKEHYCTTTKKYLQALVLPSIFILLGPFLSFITHIADLGDEFFLAFAVFNCYSQIITAASMSSGNCACLIVQERELKLKYALNVMGCRLLPFWLSHLLYDFILEFVLVVTFMIGLLIFGIWPLVRFYTFASITLLMLTFLLQAYLISWLFQKYLSSLKGLMMFQLFLLYLVPFVINILCLVQEIKSIRWMLSIFFPSTSFFSALASQTPFKLHENYWIFLMIQLMQAIALLVINMKIDGREVLAAVSGDQVAQILDDDVRDEAQRVNQNANDRVIAQKITKTFKNQFQAVKGTSFGVARQQIFGLLGPNGAGKSTTFNMITAKLTPSSGEILLEQEVIKKNKGEVFQNVGICPQFDSLYENVTVRQHLKIWSLLKGYNDIEVEQASEYFIKVMQLSLYTETKAGQLSGGNKRKLCVALALIGGTNMQFFDEPSSGLDPIAKRYLHNSIVQGIQLRDSAVVLTTHSMNEAETLCSKLAIQVNGVFVCFGTPQHLRNKFGDGYLIQITLNDPANSNEIKTQIERFFHNCKQVRDNNVQKLSFKLPKEKFVFSQTFSYLMSLQYDRKLIKDFEIIQASLESIFLHFAALQEDLNQLENTIKKTSFFSGCCGNDEDE